ncbi:hypothetical protein E4U21_005906 [Claviceps maximensis]|nr:hypothetical protein E4U21_005906 [Claviceps maximensis]
MALCKFYQQGICKYGSFCRFEHTNQNQPQNRFSALAAGGGSGGNENLEDALSRYTINIETIQKDLLTEAPTWILSAYAPGRNAPEQLFGGYPREQSFEEMRLYHLMAKASGTEQQAIEQAQELYQNAQLQMQTALSNIQEAARFVVEAENRHPNRLDICREGTQGAPFGEFLVGSRPISSVQSAPQAANPFSSGSGGTGSASPFGGGTAMQPAPSAFGQPSVLGQRPNPFGTPTFGQAAQPSLGFGQPLAQSQATPFGQASQSTGSAFGQGPQTASAFGQPSVLGARPNPFGAPAFGEPAQPAASMNGSGSSFGQVAQLGGARPNPFALGGAAATNNTTPFGAMTNGNGPAPAANPFASANSAPSNAAMNPFSSNSFDQNNSQNTQPNPFNQNNGQNTQPNPFGQQQTQSANPFGQASSQPSRPNPFATANISSQQQQQQSGNPFAQNPSNETNGGAFGSNNAQSPFGQPPPPQQNNPFASHNGQSQQQAAAAAAAGAQTQVPETNPYPPGSSKRHPAIQTYATKNADGTLATFKGRPVTYKGDLPGVRAFDGTWTRIWFPAGPPAYYKDTELPLNEYDEQSRNQWVAFQQTGSFAEGVMPDLPPLRECTLWDF